MSLNTFQQKIKMSSIIHTCRNFQFSLYVLRTKTLLENEIKSDNIREWNQKW